MACEVEGRTMTNQKDTTSTNSAWGDQFDTTKSNVTGLNPEETAMILTSLSKGYRNDRAALLSSPDLDTDIMSDMGSGEMSFHHHQLSLRSGNGKVHRVQQINFDGPKGSKLDFTDDAGCSHRFRNESNRVKSLVTKHISIEELRTHFDRPIIDVAKDFGICITLMKKICRRNGIKRWPHRQIRSLSKSIASMEAAMLSAHGSERERYRDQITNLKMKRECVIADPNRENSVHSKMLPTSSLLVEYSKSDSDSSTRKVSTRTSHGGYPLPQVNQGHSARVDNSVMVTSSRSLTTGLSKGGRWTSEEHTAFLEGIRLYGKDWRRVAQVVMTRSAVQTRTHAQKYLLKFAGRLPFDPDGMLQDYHSQLEPNQNESASMKPLASLLSPTTSVSSSDTAIAQTSDDSTSTGSWHSEEMRPNAKHGEAMAKILNGSPHVSSNARFDESNVKASALSPLSAFQRMSTYSSI
ncbi:SANT/Myb domain [Plasmopara halstedii]|uniref:SANT/Myb domain n=1 Tax=Plasmopara halstedii TaxID=4781 RepID=A0A0P1AY22_PLAHL|nr:SANT/Myb domain [Plasmopara halstedii]CEG45702.1 SANT/Myb domain [Plasmopara halstedii]|eukprot:XP_024582071.1 SANT/Myb domain [Plasmopara halstedii]